mgnify:FL=1
MESNIGMGFEEMKILYDIEPLNMTNDCKESISDNGWVTFAICSNESIILSGIHEYLQNQLQKRQLLVWSRADEIVLKNLKERYTVTSCTESQPHGFLRYSMPEILFVLNEYDDIEFLISNFNQLSSLEIYVLKNSCIENFLSVVMQHRKKYNRVDVDFFLNNSYAIINKSGDADEIEMIVPKKDFLTSLEFYL